MFQQAQHTIRHSVQCDGFGLHSGKPVRLRLKPAAENSGIRFHRTDVDGPAAFIEAHYDAVVDTRFCTTIANDAGVSVATIEHLMAAIAGSGIDNILIELDGPEVPIMDGSAAPFVFLLECAGKREQSAARRYLKVLEATRVEQGESWIEILPYEGFVIDLTIDFANHVVGRQNAVVDFAASSFKNSLSRARTFGFEEDVARLREAGLAQGGSLDNAIVVGRDAVLNEGGLRYEDEFVRHKILDALGDLYLGGGALIGWVRGYRIGHGVNNQLLHALHNAPAAVMTVTQDEMAAPQPWQSAGTMPSMAAMPLSV